jgi:hypothetical protein
VSVKNRGRKRSVGTESEEPAGIEWGKYDDSEEGCRKRCVYRIGLMVITTQKGTTSARKGN